MPVPASTVQNTTPSQSDGSHGSRRRITAFVGVALAILLAATGFVCGTWRYFWKSSTTPFWSSWPAWEIVPLALTLMFVGATLLAMRFSNPALRLAYRISAVWLGVLNFCFFAAAGAWILWGALTLLSVQVEPRMIAVLFFGGAGVTSILGLGNASWVRVTRVTVKLANLPESWRGGSVALVTDLHLGNVRGAGFARRVVARLQLLRPDAIFISGDLYDGSKANLDGLIEPWKEISAPAGIYFVTGNHEEFTNRSPFVEAVKRAGIRVLNNEKVEANGMQIVGAHDGETQHPEVYRALLQRAGLDRNRPSILLAHQPANLAIAEAAGVSLQVSGHTHGGQIWPWTWVAGRVHGRFNHGLNRLGQLQVYTSKGVGTWGVPMRVGTRAEIVLIRLESGAS